MSRSLLTLFLFLLTRVLVRLHLMVCLLPPLPVCSLTSSGGRNEFIPCRTRNLAESLKFFPPSMSLAICAPVISACFPIHFSIGRAFLNSPPRTDPKPCPLCPRDPRNTGSEPPA